MPVKEGTFDRQRNRFRNLPKIGNLDWVHAIGHDATCVRYDKVDAAGETAVTMPATVEVGNEPADLFSDRLVSIVRLRGLWGSNVPFRFQLLDRGEGLFDIRYIPMALAWSTTDYDVSRSSVEMRRDATDGKLLIETRLISQDSARDDGVVYVCEVSPAA